MVKNNIDVQTLELLPVAIILFDNKQIYYLNKKAIDLFKVPKKQLKELDKLSVFSFIDKSVHKRLINNNKLILKDVEFPPIELQCYNLNKEVIYVEAKSNAVVFNNKKVVQSTFLEINDRIDRYNQLQKTQEILHSISKSVREIIYEFSFLPFPHISFISDSVFDMLGRKPSEIYKNPQIFLDQIHPDDKEKYVLCLESYLKVTSNATNNKEVFRFYHKNGKELILEVAAKPKHQNANIVSFIGVIRDITKEKNYQQELEQKWNNYKNLLDSSPIGIFIHEGICLYANKTAANILEVKDPKKLIGKYLIEFIIPEQRERALNRMKQAISGEELSDLTYTVTTINNKTIEVELKTVPFIYNGKKVVQTIISDISAEKKLSKEKLRAELAEETNKNLKKEIEYRQKIQSELVTQTTKYEAIFNNTSHLIWTVNRDLKITSFNKNYYNYIKSIFNHDLKTGEHIGSISRNSKDKIRSNFWIEKYNNFFNNKKDNKVEFFEIKNTSSKGKIYYREIFLHPIRGANGKITEIAIIGQDTTERRLSEQKIIEQSAKLEAIFESGTQLIWTVDKNYLFTSFNKNFSDAMYSVYGVKPSLDKKIYKPQKTKVGREYHNWWIKKYDEAFKKQTSIEFTTEQLDSNGNKLYRQIFIHPIFKNGVVE